MVSATMPAPAARVSGRESQLAVAAARISSPPPTCPVERTVGTDTVPATRPHTRASPSRRPTEPASGRTGRAAAAANPVKVSQGHIQRLMLATLDSPGSPAATIIGPNRAPGRAEATAHAAAASSTPATA